MEKNTLRYQELDALRGIAAIIVVFFHFTMCRPEANLGFKLGTTGVDLFFMISGFVIFMSLNHVKSSRVFIINRISRLYPTYWFCVTFTFLLICLNNIYYHKQISFVDYLGNMTMFQHYMDIPDLDGPYWTMIIEMVFYIVILFLFQFKFFKNITFWGLALSLATVLSAYFFNKISFNKIIFCIPLLQYLPLFLSGIIFYEIQNDVKVKHIRYFYLTICFICQISLFNHIDRASAFINHLEYSIMLTFYFVLFTLFVNGKLKFIVSKATLFLGKISFALYLVHQKISIRLIIPTLVDKLNFNFWVVSIFIALPIVIALTTFITYYIEIPFNKKFKETLLKL